jgi:hypothetical protein
MQPAHHNLHCMDTEPRAGRRKERKQRTGPPRMCTSRQCTCSAARASRPPRHVATHGRLGRGGCCCRGAGAVRARLGAVHRMNARTVRTCEQACWCQLYFPFAPSPCTHALQLLFGFYSPSFYLFDTEGPGEFLLEIKRLTHAQKFRLRVTRNKPFRSIYA